MVSRVLSIVSTAVLLVAIAGFSGCAGSKSSSGGGGGGSSNSQKLEDAKRSAEEAEMNAHKLREEKNRTQSKPSGN